MFNCAFPISKRIFQKVWISLRKKFGMFMLKSSYSQNRIFFCCCFKHYNFHKHADMHSVLPAYLPAQLLLQYDRNNTTARVEICRNKDVIQESSTRLSHTKKNIGISNKTRGNTKVRNVQLKKLCTLSVRAIASLGQQM